MEQGETPNPLTKYYVFTIIDSSDMSHTDNIKMYEAFDSETSEYFTSVCFIHYPSIHKKFGRAFAAADG